MMELVIFLLKIIYGFFFVLFLPGFSLTLLIFRKKEMGITERISLSPVFSVVLIFIIIFFLEYMGIDLTALNIFLVISVFTVTSIFLWAHKSGNLVKSLKVKK